METQLITTYRDFGYKTYYGSLYAYSTRIPRSVLQNPLGPMDPSSSLLQGPEDYVHHQTRGCCSRLLWGVSVGQLPSLISKASLPPRLLDLHLASTGRPRGSSCLGSISEPQESRQPNHPKRNYVDPPQTTWTLHKKSETKAFWAVYGSPNLGAVGVQAALKSKSEVTTAMQVSLG